MENSDLKAPEQQNNLPIIVNNIVMQNVDRTPKDVERWRQNHRQAENIYYPNRSALYDLYKDIELDAFLSGIIGKRIKSVTNKKIRFVANDQENKDLCKLAGQPSFRRLCKLILKSIYWGVKGAEFIPGKDFGWKEIPIKHIKPEKGVIAINQSDYEGTPYQDIDNILVVCGEDEDVRDLGLYLKAAFYVLLKTGDFSDWANYIEIFGSPLIVTRYDTYDIKTKTQLAKAMEEIGSSMRLSIPKQAEIEIMDGKASNGNGDLQDKFAKACDNQLAILVLGNTETTGNTNGGSNAKAAEHGKQQDEIIKDDCHLLLGVLNSPKFLNILAGYGYAVQGGEWIIDDAPDEAALKVMSEVDEALKRMGLPADDGDLYKRYNRAKPADYDAQKKAQQEATQAQTAPDQPKPGNPARENKKEPGNPAKMPPPQGAGGGNGAWRNLRQALADFFDPAHKE